MKILYIGMKHDYGDPKRGLSFEHYNFYESLVSMEGGKHTIVYFPFDEHLAAKGRDGMNEELLRVVGNERPQLCFFFLFTDEIKKETIKAISDRGDTVTFNWFADDHWRFDNFSKYYAPFFHFVSTTDSKAPARYQRMGYHNVLKSQWACNHLRYKPPVDTSLKFDATFIGQPHGNRRDVIEQIKAAGIHVECWGGGWPNGRISQEGMVEAFYQSRVNLNLTKSSGGFDAKQIGKIFVGRRTDGAYHLLSPRSWLDNTQSLWHKQREQIKGRNFEIPGSGGFLLTGDADNLSDYYVDGKEIVIFRGVPDLIEKTKYYLGHESERAAIALAGYKRTLAEHTYEKRFQELFKAMSLSS